VGHTIKRCKQPAADSGDGGFDTNAGLGTVGEPSGADSWNNPAASTSAGGWDKPASAQDGSWSTTPAAASAGGW